MTPSSPVLPHPDVAPLSVACTVCRAEDHEFMYRTRLSPGPIVRCRRCGLIYVSPVELRERLAESTGDSVEVAFDPGESDAYRELYLADAAIKTSLYTELLERVESASSGPGTVLDVGSYMGLFMHTASQRGWVCQGIEPDPDARRISMERYGHEVWAGSLLTYDGRPGSFDAVAMLQVLEHLADPRQAVVQARRLLKSGGLLVLEVPNIHCWPVRVLGRRHRHFARHHFTFFSPRTLTALLEDCGFAVVSCTYPGRRLSGRLLEFGLRSWHPGLHRLLRPVFRIPRVRDGVMAVNLREVLSIVGRRTGPSGDGPG